MMIKRTNLANSPKSAAWVADYYGDAHAYADMVHEGDYPTHSPVLGADGRPLQYEPRPRMGFDLTQRGAERVRRTDRS